MMNVIRPLIKSKFRIGNIAPYFLLTLLTLVISGCQTQAKNVQAANVQVTKDVKASLMAVTGHSSTRHVLIVNSNSFVERYQTAEKAFIEQVQKQKAAPSISQIDLSNEAYPERLLQELLNEGDYSHIYCIGAKALGSIDTIAPSQPIVFSSVLSWARFEGHAGISGVASDVSPESQLTMFKHFFPELTSVAVLYSHRNRSVIRKITQAAQQVGITLNLTKINEHDSIEQQVQLAAQTSDGLWLLSDPVVLSSVEKAKQLFSSADKHQLPVLTTNRFFKDLGATFIISADRPTIGRQAALLINAPRDTKTSDKIYYPIGSHISLNIKKVEQYQLDLNFQALDSANELIE